MFSAMSTRSQSAGIWEGEQRMITSILGETELR